MAQSVAQPPPPPTFCRQCGAPLSRQAIVCRECGCVPLIEDTSAVVSSAVNGARQQARSTLRSIFTNRFALLWLLAVVPFVMVTPFAVLAYCAFMVLRLSSGLTPKDLLHLAVIGGVALINLKLSYDFSHDAISVATSWFTQWRDWLFNLRPPDRNPTFRNA